MNEALFRMFDRMGSVLLRPRLRDVEEEGDHGEEGEGGMAGMTLTLFRTE